MNKFLIALLVSLVFIPAIALADVNMQTNISTTGNVNAETNINAPNVSIAINGVTWNEYNPNYIAENEQKWSKDRTGITLGQFSVISRYFYNPGELSSRDFNLLTYLVTLIHKVVDPDIVELQYQNEALRYMMKDIYGDQYDKEYCRAKCKVAFKHNLEYVMCNDVKCHEEQPGTWYCDKPLSADRWVGVYRFYFR